MLYCPRCGEEVVPEAKFCPYCRSPAEVYQPAALSPAVPKFLKS